MSVKKWRMKADRKTGKEVDSWKVIEGADKGVFIRNLSKTHLHFFYNSIPLERSKSIFHTISRPI
jgi:hypothetical protein